MITTEQLPVEVLDLGDQITAMEMRNYVTMAISVKIGIRIIAM